MFVVPGFSMHEYMLGSILHLCMCVDCISVCTSMYYIYIKMYSIRYTVHREMTCPATLLYCTTSGSKNLFFIGRNGEMASHRHNNNIKE